MIRKSSLDRKSYLDVLIGQKKLTLGQKREVEVGDLTPELLLYQSTITADDYEGLTGKPAPQFRDLTREQTGKVVLPGANFYPLVFNPPLVSADWTLTITWQPDTLEEDIPSGYGVKNPTIYGGTVLISAFFTGTFTWRAQVL